MFSTTNSEQPQGGDFSTPLGTAACWEIIDDGRFTAETSDGKCLRDDVLKTVDILGLLCWTGCVILLRHLSQHDDFTEFIFRPISVLCDFRIRNVWQSQFLTGSTSQCMETSSCDFLCDHQHTCVSVTCDCEAMFMNTLLQHLSSRCWSCEVHFLCTRVRPSSLHGAVHEAVVMVTQTKHKVWRTRRPNDPFKFQQTYLWHILYTYEEEFVLVIKFYIF